MRWSTASLIFVRVLNTPLECASEYASSILRLYLDFSSFQALSATDNRLQKFNREMSFEIQSSLRKIFAALTLSWRRPLSYRNQYIDLQSKSIDWFLPLSWKSWENIFKSTFTLLLFNNAKVNKPENLLQIWPNLYSKSALNCTNLTPRNSYFFIFSMENVI